MAITKETKIEKIEVVGEYKAVQVRTDTVIKEDGKELSRSSHRHVKHPDEDISCLLYTSPSPRDGLLSRMPSSA